MTWFIRITGFPEGGYSETQARLRVENGRLIPEGGGPGLAIGELELVSLDELRARSHDVTVPGRLTLGTVEGDVRKMHVAPENEGAVFQVASQFNLLEMTGPGVTPEHGVTGYAHDHTQGPACAIAAGAGTIWRHYLVPVGDRIGQTADRQLDGLADLGAALAWDMGVEKGSLWQMRNGYALADSGMLARIEAHLNRLDERERDQLRGLLRVGLHRDVGVTEPATGFPAGFDLRCENCIALRSKGRLGRITLDGLMVIIAGWRDRQNPADRLDAIVPTMIVNENNHLFHWAPHSAYTRWHGRQVPGPGGTGLPRVHGGLIGRGNAAWHGFPVLFEQD